MVEDRSSRPSIPTIDLSSRCGLSVRNRASERETDTPVGARSNYSVKQIPVSRRIKARPRTIIQIGRGKTEKEAAIIVAAHVKSINFTAGRRPIPVSIAEKEAS